MHKLLTTFMVCVIASQLAAQPNKCAKFKTGYYENIDPGGKNTYIKRTANIQTEWEKMLGAKLRLKITWIDDCTYKLRPLGGNAQWKKENPHALDKHELIVRITDTGDDYYWLSAKMDGVEMREYTSKIIKIKHW
jgi:hypothetical protein